MAQVTVTPAPKVRGYDSTTAGDTTTRYEDYDYLTFGIGSPTRDTPVAHWTGAYPFLDTADEFTSAGDASYPWHIAGLFPASPALRGDLTIEVQAYKDTPETLDIHFGDWGDAETRYANIEMPAGGGQYPAGQWVTDSYTFTADSAIGDALRDGRLTFFGGSAGTPAARGTVISMVRLRYQAGIPPLRQVQRDDGLLRSARRARGGRSRQGSLRQRGYL